MFLKHFIADFLFQTKYMLQKGARTGWFLPLLEHAGVHSLLTIGVGYIYTGSISKSVLIGFLDLFSHFLIDRGKVLAINWLNGLGSKFISERCFFWILGLDQCLHMIFYYLLVMEVL